MAFVDTELQLKEFSEFIKLGWEAAANVSVLSKISNIIVCGMGGSGIPGDILSSYVNLDIPIVTVKNYRLPGFVNNKSLVFIISYSGNTEEALSCFKKALGIGSRIIGITSGGKLKKLCERHKKDLALAKKGLQPRSAIPLLLMPLIRVLHNSKLIDNQETYVKKAIEALSKDVYSDMGKKLAEKLKDKIPIIYASENYKSVAYRWKTQLNENAKILAFSQAFPELNHNEIVGYEHLVGDYYVIMIQDEADLPKIKKRMSITKGLIGEKGVSSTVIVIKGACKLSKILSAIHIGDWTSLHLAGLYGIDPTPVDIIENLKKQL